MVDRIKRGARAIRPTAFHAFASAGADIHFAFQHDIAVTGPEPTGLGGLVRKGVKYFWRRGVIEPLQREACMYNGTMFGGGDARHLLFELVQRRAPAFRRAFHTPQERLVENFVSLLHPHAGAGTVFLE